MLENGLVQCAHYKIIDYSHIENDAKGQLISKQNCRALCPIHVITFTLISNLVTDYIQKRRGEPGLFSFEYNLSPNLISK